MPPPAALLPVLLALGLLPGAAGSPNPRKEPPELEVLRAVLEDFDVLPMSGLQTHSVQRRDAHVRAHVEKLLSFSALQRHFRLYLRTNDGLFTEDFRAVVVEQNGEEKLLDVNRHAFFTGHVIGEEHSRVQAHVDQNEFSARILTAEAEYHVEPLWRFTPPFTPPPERGPPRLLVYRSRDIRDIGRLQQPSVCGYLTSDPSMLLPHAARAAMTGEGGADLVLDWI
ncbi:disintegrin and metalloproteinase domain-containing protein 17-like [Menidia menidia]